MKTFVDYYNTAKQEHGYTIKLARNSMTDSETGALEAALEKYNMSSMDKIARTPIQLEPIDFPNVRNTEVYIAKIVLEYPITPDALRREIADCMEMSEAAVAVYAQNDPRHQYVEQWNERMTNKEAYKSKYTPRLGSEQEFEPEPAYGDGYNTPFLKSLADVKKKHQDAAITNDLIPAQVTDKETVTGDEKGKQNNDAVLKDRWRDASTETTKKGKNTMMSTPSKEK